MRVAQWRQGILIGIFLLVSAWLVWLIWGLVGKAQIAVREARSAERQYKVLEDRRSTIETNLATLATVRGQDAAVRMAFGVARPGEEVIVVVPSEAATVIAPLPWWKKVLPWLIATFTAIMPNVSNDSARAEVFVNSAYNARLV